MIIENNGTWNKNQTANTVSLDMHVHTNKKKKYINN